ncbi:ATP-binding protein [Natrinema sp. H-ect4]|uniref:ATP-binding protein n=1 Tax=Natrinema sp. H-ect4 TaxID=3242699 RepID=UPI0035A86DAC
MREKLYEIFRQDLSFEQKARDALDLGADYLDADNGHLTRIDRENDHWKVMVSTDPPDGQFPAEMERDLGTTYCRRTIEEDDPIALYDAPNQGWAGDPAFETLGFHSYHGTTLIPNGNPYGTVGFVSESPRPNQFRDEETMLAELLTRLLERELKRVQLETELTRYTNLSTVLNRVLRHNLRNDLSVIRGFTELIGDKLEDQTESEKVLTKIDNLLELSNKARELDRIVAADFERESTDLGALMQEVIDDVSQEYPSASITVDYDYGISTPVLPSFTRAIEQLIKNAAKHSGESPSVTVTIESVPNGAKIQITDNGPGLADHEAEVLETGTETPLTHGSGLGLWLTHWIVTAHGGSIEASGSEAGTTMTITLPKKSDIAIQEQLAKITQARDQYQEVFEKASDAMVIINDDTQIVSANSEAANIYGLDSQELLGQRIPEFFPEDFDFEAEWQQLQTEGRTRSTVTIVGRDGEEREVDYSAATDVIPGKHLMISRESIDHQP